MKTLVFILSMPNVGSWNNKWTGSENIYAVKRKVKDDLAKLIMRDEETYYDYDFGDGWRASIEVKVLPAKEVNKIIKKSRGFYGYEWMVESILLHQEIKFR